ncbi:hypothetical protein ACIHFE_18195 [Streptomyces sp. NPDC052396]|uniref:DUF7848 domain-containing protein n=1 Tax=Streptomyces sp. NPDC052396 TaxID=3365689 RepID=UPI0037CEB078
MGTSYRFVDFLVRRCETEDRKAVCVTSLPGACASAGFLPSDCGAASPWLTTGEQVTDWMRHHTRDTGHLRFERTTRDQVLMEPPGGIPEGCTDTLPKGWTP